MIRQTYVGPKITVALLLLFLLLSVSSPLQAQDTDLSVTLGRAEDPIQVVVFANGNLGVFSQDPYSGFIARTYDDFVSGTLLTVTLDGQPHRFVTDVLTIWGGLDADTDVGIGSQDETATAVTTRWPLGDSGLTLVQTVALEPGSTRLQKTFSLSQTGNQLATDLTLSHFVRLRAEPVTISRQADGSVRVINDNLFEPRALLLEAHESSPWTRWQMGEATTVMAALANQALDQTVADTDSPFCVVAWELSQLQAGETWSVQTFEDYGLLPAAEQPTPTPHVTETSVQPTGTTADKAPTPSTSTSQAPQPTQETTTSNPTHAPTDPIQTEQGVEELPQTGERPLSAVFWALVPFSLMALLLVIRKRKNT